jgi:hypothetical protein
MLAPTSTPPYTPLPNEQTLFTSSPRISFDLKIPAHYPGKQQQPFHLASPSGVAYLTNRRILFLPDKPSPQLQSFAAPILNLHDSHVAAPWFGPNVWTALLQPTAGGGIPVPAGGVVEVKLTFKEGGAFDFHSHYERVRERLLQAVEVSRDSGVAGSAAAMNGVDVNLDDLPAYQEEGDGPLLPPTVTAVAAAQESVRRASGSVNGSVNGDGRARPRDDDTPVEPPPGYEEAQMASLRDEVERRLEREGR